MCVIVNGVFFTAYWQMRACYVMKPLLSRNVPKWSVQTETLLPPRHCGIHVNQTQSLDGGSTSLRNIRGKLYLYHIA